MIPMLGWFILILVLLLLAILAIKFLVLRILLVFLLALPILLTAGYIALKQSPVTESNRQEFFSDFKIATESINYNTSLNFETLAAFKSAKSAGVDTIQMNVRMTKDGVLIIYKFADVTDSDNVTYEIAETHSTQLFKLKNVKFLHFDDAVTWCIKNDIKMLMNIPFCSSDLLTYIRNNIMQDEMYGKVALTTTNVLTALQIRLKDSKLILGFSWGSTSNSIINGVTQGNAYTSWIFKTIDSALYWSVRSLILPGFIGADFLITNVADADGALISELASSSILTVVRNVTTSQEKSYFQKQLNLPIMLTTLKD
ncbi:unnamed protein product [Caenorhabditis angaria]|uniref:GP-PDE domain-containing protein n=1 Tax=Caenorhabditis angaria TaxID=860376 RepID=A0A9P1J4W4_9PELO|nr:unnamed protein product [Caenorhabditis angaria]